MHCKRRFWIDERTSGCAGRTAHEPIPDANRLVLAGVDAHKKEMARGNRDLFEEDMLNFDPRLFDRFKEAEPQKTTTTQQTLQLSRSDEWK